MERLVHQDHQVMMVPQGNQVCRDQTVLMEPLVMLEQGVIPENKAEVEPVVKREAVAL